MLALTPFQYGWGAASGMLVGLTLGLVGGGGSIMAVPLMLYLVGVRDPHVAIGTSAFAVATNAVAGLITHARKHTVKWRCGGVYSSAGVIGAIAGSTVGMHVEGQRLLFLFSLLMILVGILMVRRRHAAGDAGAQCNAENAWKVMGFGAGTGALSGFFGIGGGFLIVPGLVESTGMPILNAIGTSLVAVAAFGLTTSINYALSNLVDWPLAIVFIAGGIMGSGAGTKLATRLAQQSGRLSVAFSVIIFAAALYMLWRSVAAQAF